MMASSSTTALLKKGKRGAAKYVHHSCLHASSPHHLQELLDLILNPCKTINEWEAIDWLKWLMAGGSTPDEFASLVRRYDNATTCGLVWTANFVAYRCRTCGISPCMSLCAECFQMSNHYGHDFNMFRSQAGGACDCGDTSVMKETGFCTRHGPRAQMNKPNAPSHLMCVAEAIMPRIIYRLIQHLRENSNLNNENDEAYTTAIKDADLFLTMLRDLNALGAAMRRVMTTSLINPQVYRNMNEYKTVDDELNRYVEESYRLYSEAVLSFPNNDPPEEYKDCPSLQKYLVHRTFLDELVFWTVKFEFPQKIVCLLLNMLPDPDYKEALTQAFVLHYSRIAMMLERCRDPDTLSNRVVHVSVQLFSNEALAYRMAQEYNLLHVMVISLRNMMSKIIMECALHDLRKNFHYVVDCAVPVMKEHCYWPLVSDLNNVLSHRPVAMKFMTDDNLPEMWFTFILMFQGMNVNTREQINHVEFEPTTYYAAFSAELEASAYPMWALVSHLSNAETAHLTKRVVTSCLVSIQDWLDAINYDHPNVPDACQISFHLPLHRYLAVLTCQAVRHQGLTLAELLPPPDLLHLIMMHPLRVQAGFYEILAQLWAKNGLQMRGQAMTYIQCNFCNSMVDADLFLLQVIATRLPSEVFLTAVIDKFRILDWLSMSPFATCGHLFLNNHNQSPMVESFLTFMATLLGARTNIGDNETELAKLEIVTLLCMYDKTHSQILELLPERCGTAQTRDFEATLDQIADYRAPNLEASGNMQQGIYQPKPNVWRDLYDPIHVLLRAVHRKDYQTSIDRFTSYARGIEKVRPKVIPWPPYRKPTPVHPAFEDPCKILGSRLFHATAFVILHKTVYNQNVTDNSVALVIHLLDLAVIYDDPHPNTQVTAARQSERPHQFKDKDLLSWYQSDWLSNNLRTTITRVIMDPEPTVVFDSSDNEGEWDRDMEVLDTSQQLDNSVLELEILETTPLASPQIDLRSRTPPGIEWNPNASGALPTALPAPVVLPAVMAGTEIVPHAGPSTSEVSTVSTTSGAECALVPASPSTNPSSSTEASGAVVKKSRTIRRRVRGKQPASEENPSIGIDSSSSDTSPQAPCDSHIDVNESIISLLLRLHSNLSGRPDSFDPKDDSRSMDDYVGDGAWFVARLLHRIYRLDDPCREAIMETKARLWPNKTRRPSPAKEECRERRDDDDECDERKRRAKERQKQVLEEIANQQKQFLERALNDEEEIDIGMEWREINSAGTASSDDIPDESSPLITTPPPEYQCVICTQTTPSLEEKPIGLVVLVQPTSVLGFKRRLEELPKLPTSEPEKAEFQRRDDTQGSEFEKRFEELSRYFNIESVMMSVSQAWQSGVHLLTCGHYLHLDCLKSYQQALRTSSRQQNLSIEGGEFMCPLCRQLANSVLPISPRLGECAVAMVRSRGKNDSNSSTENVKETDRLTISNEIADLLKENPPPPSAATGLEEAMSKAMGDMRVASQIKFKQRSQYPSWQSVFLFVSSIARTNLEVEILRAGALNKATHAAPPKRSCIVPLLHVLAMHARALAQWPAWDTWARLSGISLSTGNRPAPVLIQKSAITAPPDPSVSYPQALIPAPSRVSESAVVPVLPEVPLLLRDPTALLIHFVLLLPLHLDQVYFTSVVQTLYNLMYVQAVVQLTYSFSISERNQWSAASPTEKLQSLDEVLSLVIRSLEASQLYNDEIQASCSNIPIVLKQGQEPMATNMDINLLKNEVYKLCLPFMRVAALLRHHLYERLLPEVASSNCPPPAPPGPDEDSLSEFQRLITYLDLETSLVTLAPQTAVSWCSELGSLCAATTAAARPLLAEAHIMWHPPRLLKLPRLYDTIFQFYHRRACSQCHLSPRESTICLICGTNLCLRDSCCKQNSVCEGVQHSIDCGGGTAIFLVVTSSYVVVVKGKRACIWGTVYLDTHGEEDRELKRGKPLLLSTERYALLEEQWLSHRFDHTSKKNWVWHRDGL